MALITQACSFKYIHMLEHDNDKFLHSFLDWTHNKV